VPKLLPDIINLIRMIWTLSKFYNTPDLLTGLLRKVSNQIIIQCSKKIELDDIFDGDVEASMVQLRESIKCGEMWHDIYERTVQAVAKDPNPNPRNGSLIPQLMAFLLKWMLSFSDATI